VRWGPPHLAAGARLFNCGMPVNLPQPATEHAFKARNYMPAWRQLSAPSLPVVRRSLSITVSPLCWQPWCTVDWPIVCPAVQVEHVPKVEPWNERCTIACLYSGFVLVLWHRAKASTLSLGPAAQQVCTLSQWHACQIASKAIACRRDAVDQRCSMVAHLTSA